MSLELQKEDLPLINEENDEEETLTRGQRVADRVTSILGSWRFIIIQSICMVIWIILNAFRFAYHWDPYPFILLNLALSFQAAFATPLILMSANRQAEKDRGAARYDLESDLRTEQIVRAAANELHQRMDEFEEMLEENTRLTQIRRRGKRGNLTLLPSDTQPLDEEETSNGSTDHV